MAGGYPPSASRKPPHYSSDRKSRWESSSSDTKHKPPNPHPNPNPSNNKPNPNPNPNPNKNHPTPQRGAIPPPPPPPSYDFHMLDRRTLLLADGTPHTYLCLPLDYQDFIPPPPPPPPPPPRHLLPPSSYPPISPNNYPNAYPNPNQDYWDSLGLDGRHPADCPSPLPIMKRKFGDVEDQLARQRQNVLQYGNAGPVRREDDLFSSSSSSIRPSKAIRGSFDALAARPVHHYQTVDPSDLNKAFHKFAKLLNENTNQKKYYFDNANHGPRQCITCNRSNDIPDVHGLIMHAYNSDRADLRVDHLGFHKALCVLMGWNYMKPPDNSKAYQYLPADEASASRDDLILWPPTVMVHNTATGKGKEGRIEGVGNKTMDSIIRALGFPNGKSRALYNKEGHLGIVLIKFSADQPGLREAIRLSEYFEKDNRGRRAWEEVQSTLQGKDDDKNSKLVKVDARTREKRRIYYAHLFTAFDLDKVDFDTRKRAVLESKQEYLQYK